MEKALECTSCKVRAANLEGTARFMCPNCSKVEIVRCKYCRAISAKYKCPECGFIGPN